MRVLVVSDLHANPAALAAIREPFDLCLCIGDIVEYGPDSAPCIDWVRDNRAVCVRGNHDHGAAQNVAINGTSGFRYLTMITRRATIAKLSQTDRRFLADLPTTQMLTIDSKRYFLVHASPRDPLDEYVPSESNSWEARLTGIKADFLLVGHTHIPFQCQAGNTTVLNPGSVGLPRDGDPRASYAIIENGKVELKRVAYDIEATIAAVQATDIDPAGKQLLADAYRAGKYVHNNNGNGKH